MIDIGETVPGQDGMPAPAIQQQAPRLRTDLDAFSELEWRVLYDHGYSVARKVLGPHLAQASPDEVKPPGDPAYSPWQEIANTAAGVRRSVKQLKAGQRQRWRPWVGWDWYSTV